jgi:hypothetical protein
MADPRFAQIRQLAIPGVLAAYFALIVMSNGVPALRHDWNWPDYYAPFLNAISGWSEQGIGGAGLFVNNYLLVSLLAPVGALAGPFATLFVFVYGIAVGVLLAARKLAGAMGATALAATAVSAFALFNPWVYTKLVAGHLPMIVAYAATMVLASEAMRAKPRAAVCALAIAFTVPQLQFFVPALAIAIIVALRSRIWSPAATWLVVGGPTLLGLLFRAKEFATTPLTLPWEQAQSIAPLSAVLLSGYFAKYTLGFDKLGYGAVAVIVILVVAGFVLSWPSRSALVIGAVTVCALVIAMGLRGPAAGLLAAIFLKVPAFALYRELYDVIGYVAIGYVVFAAVAASRNALFLSALCVAVLLLMGAWMHFSPARQWADRASLPTLANVARPQTRFALLPPFQPLRYEERFAGLDPDAVIRAESVTPVNEEVPTWPEDSALVRYQRTGDWRPLADLSVSEITNRTWYTSARRELLEQLALATPRETSDRERIPFSVGIPAIPEVSLIATPPVVAVPSEPGAGAVFFGDVAGLRGHDVPAAWALYERPTPVGTENQFVHASDGWVDARLGFASDPELGQPFGGALTTNPSATLSLNGGDAALVFVRGALVSDDGTALMNDSGRYRWISIPVGEARVHCRGLCVVALEGHVPLDTKNVPMIARYTGLSGATLTPWLLRIEMPAGPAAALRYNARYDEHWLAWSASKPLVHVRIDGSVNGWLLGERSAPGTVWLIEWVALLQTAAQAVGLLWLCVLLWSLARSRAAQA